MIAILLFGISSIVAPAFSAATVGYCPDGWTKHSDTCYHFSHDKQEWSGAMDICKLFNGHLVEIQSQEENAYVWNHVRSTGNNYWIGLQDLIEEDIWQWISSLAIVSSNDYTNWGTGKPDNRDNKENCAVVDHYAGTWDDQPCQTHNYYVCERAPITTRRK